jgi:hypothetical protein
MEEVRRQIRAKGALKPRKIPPISQYEFRLTQQAVRSLWRGETLFVLPGVEPRLLIPTSNVFTVLTGLPKT